MTRTLLLAAAIAIAVGPLTVSLSSNAFAADNPVTAAATTTEESQAPRTYDEAKTDFEQARSDALVAFTGDRAQALHERLQKMMDELQGFQWMYSEEVKRGAPSPQWLDELAKLFAEGAKAAEEEDELTSVDPVWHWMVIEDAQSAMEQADPQRYAAEKAALDAELDPLKAAEKKMSEPLDYLKPFYQSLDFDVSNHEKLLEATHKYLDEQAKN